MSRIGAIIFCRLDSQRLPGKALRPIQGQPLFELAVQRCRRVSGLAEIVLATTDRPVDEPLVQAAQERALQVFRGSTEDVAGRALACAQYYNMDYFFRLNGDSPFVDEQLLTLAMQGPDLSQYDLVTNLYPRSFPYGVSVELIRTTSLARAYQQFRDQAEYEHLTTHFYRHAERFRMQNLACPEGDCSSVRMTIDTAEDWQWLEQIAQQAPRPLVELSYRDVLAMTQTRTHCQ